MLRYPISRPLDIEPRLSSAHHLLQQLGGDEQSDAIFSREVRYFYLAMISRVLTRNVPWYSCIL